MKFSVLISVDRDVRPIAAVEWQRMREALPRGVGVRWWPGDDGCEGARGGVARLTIRARSREDASAKVIPAFAQLLDSTVGTQVGMRWVVTPVGWRFFVHALVNARVGRHGVVVTDDTGPWRRRRGYNGGSGRGPGSGVREPRRPGPGRFPPAAAAEPEPSDG